MSFPSYDNLVMATAPKSTQEQSQRSLYEPFSPHCLIRHYYAKLCTTLDSSPTNLKSLCGEMYSEKIIDDGTMNDVMILTHTKGGYTGANALLKYVKKMIELRPTILETVLCILEKEEILRIIVQNMRKHPLETNGIYTD